MALPRILQKLFQNGGAGPRLLKTILPEGVVFSVNGSSPDADGDVSVSIPTYTHPATHPASMITGLATVATSGSYDDLSNRPSIPATPKAYVTTTWKSGASWYRMWSDGWIEQGGSSAVTTATGTTVTTTTVTLNTAFSNANYTVVVQGFCGNTSASSSKFYVSSKGASSFVATLQNSTVSPIDWYACGY